jgi:anaerobic selenocysteine-containing dehydrogenase
MDIDRRDFLKVGLFTAGTVTGGSLWGKIGTGVVQDPPWDGPPGEEKFVYSVCQMCPNGCGIRVRLYEGRAVGVEGNPHHPLNLGGLCPRGRASLQLLYHPKRLKYPVMNKDGKGKGNWQRLTFDEAIGMVGQTLNSLLRTRSTHHLALAYGGYSDLENLMLQRFCNSIGTPNYLRYESPGRRSMSMAMGLTHGIFSPATVDWDHCNYLLLFGTEPGASDVSPMWLTKSFGRLRRGRAGHRAKIVHIGTRFSPFSSKVDEWIKVNPGTYGALALGIAYVIINEEKYNIDFIESNTLGFRETMEIDGSRKPGFRDHVLKNYTPEIVSNITGVPASTIVRLGEEFASTRPAVAYGGDGPASYSNAVTELIAIHSLNALVGSIDVPGGIMIQRDPPLKLPAGGKVNPLLASSLKQERVDAGEIVSGLPLYQGATGLTSRLRSSSPYPVEFMMMVDFNPVAEMPDSSNWEKALAEIPFVVSFSNFIDESSRYADLIIPPGMFFERWDGRTVDSSTGFAVFGLSRPIFDQPPAGPDVVNFFLKLSRKMGSGIADQYPWNSSEELLKEMVADFDQLQGNPDPWAELTRRGFWSNGPYSFGHQRQVYNTRGNRFYFYLYPMEAVADALFRKGFRGPGSSENGLANTDFLPNHIPPGFSESGPDYPLHLELFATTITGAGRFAFLDGLREIQELGLNRSWGQWVLINHKTAERFHVHDGDKVMLTSSNGKISATIRIYHGIQDDTAGLIFGQGRRLDGPEPVSESAFSLITESTSHIGGGICWNGTKVKITRI